VETHLALLGWVPFRWGRGAAERNGLVVWLNWTADEKGDYFGWSYSNVFPMAAFDEVRDWPRDDEWFWKLAKGLTEDQRFI
jgi:hypothetical protein